MFEHKDVYIFDLDGTLIDSLGMWNEVDRILIQHLGGDPLTEEERQARRECLLAKYHKEPDPYVSYCGVLKELCKSPLSAVEIKNKRYEIARDFLVNTVSLKPGAAELLHTLKNAGKTLILASATSRSNIKIYAEENALIYKKAHFPSLFDKIYTRDDVSEMKPSPAVYVKVLSEGSYMPEKCIVIEDSLSGVEAANKAGLDVVAVYDKHSENDRNEIASKTKGYFSSCGALLSAIRAAGLL